MWTFFFPTQCLHRSQNFHEQQRSICVKNTVIVYQAEILLFLTSGVPADLETQLVSKALRGS